MEIKPIGYIYTDFKDKFGIPRQSGRVPELKGRIVFEPQFRNPDAIRGIENFSHLWIIFGFDRAEGGKSLTVRPPRLGGNTRVGVFASRSPFRPNSMGLSVVKLEKIENTLNQGSVIEVSGVDILDGTPVYDIKPYIPYADCIPDAEGSFGQENRDYALEVVFPQDLLEIIPEEKRTAAVQCLKDDPRPSYQDDSRIYSMRFAGYDVHFRVAEGVLTVEGVDKI